MMQKIRSGTKPTDVFKELLAANPSFSKSDISANFIEEFPDVDSVASQVIWNWRKPGQDRGVEDARIDEILLHHLKEAGYL